MNMCRAKIGTAEARIVFPSNNYFASVPAVKLFFFPKAVLSLAAGESGQSNSIDAQLNEQTDNETFLS
jgi:hypothetical protein